MKSVLDEPLPPLSELLDTASFKEVCNSFSELYGIGVKVFDADGHRITDVRVGAAEHCAYLFSVHPTQKMCTQLVNQIKSKPLDAGAKHEQVDCFSGLRYKIMPVVYEGTFMGRLIFGPFAPPELQSPPAALQQYTGDGLDLNKLAALQRSIPRAGDQVVEKVLKHMGNVIDVIIHNSYKMYVTSRLHISSVAGAFADLEQTNVELRRANERLQDLDRLKSNFIATVSHELRTPLTSVIGYSEMLLEGMAGEINDEQRDYVGTILEKGESLLNLIGQILDLSRIESGNLRLHRVLAQPQDVMKLSLSDVTPQALKKQVKLCLQVADSVAPLRFDVDKVRRIVTNLLGNAVKFTPNGGTVSVLLDVCDDTPVGEKRYDMFEPERNRFLRIRVRDTGIGIPEDKLQQVFESFFQVDNTSTREYSGTGLGLAIVRNFVRAHRGRVEASSELGKGSTFVVKLPYSETTAAGAAIDGLAAS